MYSIFVPIPQGTSAVLLGEMLIDGAVFDGFLPGGIIVS